MGQLIGLTKPHGERVLVNPDQIIYVEVGGGGTNIYLARGEMLKVRESVEAVEALLGGGPAVTFSVGPQEFKHAGQPEEAEAAILAADESDLEQELTGEGVAVSELAAVLEDDGDDKPKNRKNR